MVASKAKARGGSSKLTASMVPVLPAGDHTDPSTQGLQLRVREGKQRVGAGKPRAARAWMFRYRWGDQSVRICIGHAATMSLVDARARALELRRALDDGIDPRRARPRRGLRGAPLPLSSAITAADRHSIDFLVSEFVTRHVRQHRRDPKQAERLLTKEVLAPWRGRDARSIKPREVIELLDGIVDRPAPVQANRVASLLTQMFRYGIHRQLLEQNPVQLLVKPGGKEKPRQRALSDDELAAYLHDPLACTREPPPHARHRGLADDGARRKELVTAR